MMKLYQMKYKPHGINRYHQFIQNDVVGIGWPGIGDLSNSPKKEIKHRLKEVYKIEGNKLGNSLGAIWCFVHTMQKGDVILVRFGNKVSIGIVGEYRYVPQLDNDTDGFCHQRSVQWIETNELLTQYNEAVNSTVRSPGIVTGSRYTIEDLEITTLLP